MNAFQCILQVPWFKSSPILKLFKCLGLGAIFVAMLQSNLAQAQFGGGMGGMGGMGGGMGRRGMSNSYPRDSSARESSKTSERTTGVDQVLYQLSTLQLDLKLNADQESKWFEFSEAVRAYVDDQVRQKFKDQTRQINTNEANTGLAYLAKLVDNSSHQYSDLEEIEIKAKALYPFLSNEQRVLFDLRVPTIVITNLFFSPAIYPNNATPPLPYSSSPVSGNTSGASLSSAPFTNSQDPQH